METSIVFAILAIVFCLVGLFININFKTVLGECCCMFLAICCLCNALAFNYMEKKSFDESFTYKAELKNGEIVEATMCSDLGEKSSCIISITDERGHSTLKEYVVTSYEKKSECENQCDCTIEKGEN